jgi:DNA-binding FadR family transcriptional regulator
MSRVTSPTALLEPATSELLESPLSPELLEDLAEQLKLSVADVAPYIAPQENGATSLLREIVRQALQLIHTQERLDRVHVRRLASLRIFFETAIAWEIADSLVKRRLLLDRLRGLHAKFAHFAQSSQLTPILAEQIWQLDGQFHRQLFEMAGRKHLADVVDMVLERLKRIGMPHQMSDVTDTLAEHQELLDALECEASDREQRILRAITNHIENASRRWFAKEGRMQPKELDELSRRWIERLAASATPERAAAEAEFERQLPALLQKHPGKWVGFHGERLVTVDSTQTRVFRRCESERLSLAGLVIRKIVPPAADDED